MGQLANGSDHFPPEIRKGLGLNSFSRPRCVPHLHRTGSSSRMAGCTIP